MKLPSTINRTPVPGEPLTLQLASDARLALVDAAGTAVALDFSGSVLAQWLLSYEGEHLPTWDERAFVVPPEAQCST